MESVYKKAIIVLGIVFCFTCSVFIDRVFSYDSDISHPMFTENIAFIYNDNFDRKLSNQEIAWLKWGSIEEDLAPRWMRHFYEPNLNKGLAMYSNSKDWAQSPVIQATSLGGNYSWQKAIEAYAAGDNEKAFIALGHVLHLIEDASVPAHTRLDPHPSSDPYEKWVEEKILDDINFKVNPIIVSNLSEVFYQLAMYSNKYFFSEDTIDKNRLSQRNTFIKKTEKNEFVECIEGVDNSNNKFCLVLVENFYFNKIYYIDDPAVHTDYFNLLGPKAVAHGAGVVKLFFEEAEKKKQEEEAKSWWQKTKNFFNQTKEKLFGSVFSVLTDENGQENQSNESQNNQVNQNNSNENINNENENIEVNFNPPTEAPVNNLSLLDNQQNNQNNQSSQNNQENNTSQNNNGNNNSDSDSDSDSDKNGLVEQGKNGNSKNENIDSEIENNESDTPSVGGAGSSGSSPQFNPGWNLDTTPPQTTATSTLFSDNSTTATTTAIFEFSSSETNSTFECKLDNAVFANCVSPFERNNLAAGAHNFQIRAIDEAGNQNQTPEIISWIIDVSGPDISNISVSNITRTTATINFATDEGAYGKIEYGTTTLYGLETILAIATSTAHAVNLTGLEAGQDYHFRALAKDEIGNETRSGDNVFSTSGIADYIVISEIQTNGTNGADDEWIELYNPTNQSVDLSLWSIQYRGGGAVDFKRKLFDAGNAIPAQGYFLIANSDYQGGVSADLSHNSFSMSATGGNVFLVNGTTTLTSATSTTIIDKLAYGAGTYLFPETNVFAGAPASEQSLERKANASSTAASMSAGDDKWQGNGYDLDNNSSDFILQASPTPQNSDSLIEPRSSFPSQPLSLLWPMFQNDAKHQAYSATGPTASTSTLLFSGAGINFLSPPALADNKIFVGANNGLYAFDINGNQLWHFLAGEVWTTPAISSDGIIYARSDSGIYAIYADGTLKWRYLMAGNYHSSSPNIDKNGNVYTISNGKLYSFYPDGRIKWIFDITQPPLNRIIIGSIMGSPAIDNSLERIYINLEDRIYALDFNGSMVWDFQNDPAFSSAARNFSTPAVGNDGTIYAAMYVGGAIGGFYALNPDGTTKWFNSIGFSASSELAPAISQSGKVYFTATKYESGATTKLFSFDAQTGVNDWNISTGDGHSSSPLVVGGNIHLSIGFNIAACDVSGNGLWQASGDGSYLKAGFGAVDSNGNLYFAVNGKIYRVGN